MGVLDGSHGVLFCLVVVLVAYGGQVRWVNWKARASFTSAAEKLVLSGLFLLKGKGPRETRY